MRHDEDAVATIVDDAVRQYFQSRREQVDQFIDQHFSMRGSARLHRHAVGWDVLRAPVNLVLAAPNAAVKLAAVGATLAKAHRAADYLHSRNLLLETAVAREVEWLIATELLETPFLRDDRSSDADALAGFIMSHPQMTAAVEELNGVLSPVDRESGLRQRLEDAVAAYTGSRTAAADITTTLLTVSAGAAALHQFTPGTVSLSTSLATLMAHQAAIASFPLGATLGGAWYSVFSVSVSPLLIAGTTAGFTAVAGLSAAFANILADPVQRRFGIHRRRLIKLIDTLERQFFDERARFAAREHYVAKLMDIGDLMATIYRLARP